MTELEAFDFRGREVRVVADEASEPWWVAADVCVVLGIVNPSSSLAQLDDDERGLRTMETPSGAQSMAVVNEAGLYSLILRSRKPEAKAFKRWVTHEVLPTIRKHGAYATPATVERMLSDPDTMIRTLQALKGEREARERAEIAVRTATDELEVVKPKADAWEDFIGKAKGDMSMSDAAKHLASYSGLKVGLNRLYDWMRENRWVYRLVGDYGVRGHKPYQARIDQGHLTYAVEAKTIGNRIVMCHVIKVTPRGLDLLRRQMLAGNVTALPPTG